MDGASAWGNISDPVKSLQNAEIEQGLLGAIFVNNKAFEQVADLILPDDFSFPTHGAIYSTIGKLLAEGQPATAVTVANIMPDQRGYLPQLIASAVSIVNAPHYARMIADLSRRRELILAAQEAIADASVIDIDRPADTVLDEAEERLYRISERKATACGPVPLGSIIADSVKRIEAAYKAGGAVTVDTGLVDLDRIISGMGAGDLCVLAGRPSMGKSCLAGTIAMNVARAGKRSAIFSLEMSREELCQRWIAGLTGISTDRQRHGQLSGNEWGNLSDAAAFLDRLPVVIDDQPRLSVSQIRLRARRVRRRLGLDLIIIDHLHLIRQGGKQESRRLEIGDATSMLKAVGKELGVPVLLLAQLNRAVESRENKRPGLSDLKESGDIEQDADLVMFLYREEYYLCRSEPRRKPGQTAEAHFSELADWQERVREVHGIAEIEVAKNRHGRTGLARVAFNAERQRFDNLAS